MTVDTEIDRARDRVQRELAWTSEKRDAFERFADAVAEIEPAIDPAGGVFGTTTAIATGGHSETGVSAVLDAFEHHLEPYSGDARQTPETVHEAVATEFSTELAVSLCGGDSGGTLTPQLKQVVQRETTARVDELDVMEAALQRERESLAAVDSAVTAVCEWFVEHNPTPLAQLDFDRLREWHETLDGFRDRLDEVAADRQRHLDATTSTDGAVGIDHRVLVEYCYAGFESSYPALATVARLDDACRDAQHSLRTHLVTTA